MILVIIFFFDPLFLTTSPLAPKAVQFRNPTEEEIHAVASVLKMFLRELPEPVFTYELYTPILQETGCGEYLRPS